MSIPVPIAVIFRRQPPGTPTFTPGRKNARLTERVSPHEAPDPIRQGSVPARAATNQVATAFHESFASMDDRFTGRIFVEHNAAGQPRGRQTSFGARSNVRVPPHVAYGSLFTSAEPTYGHG